MATPLAITDEAGGRALPWAIAAMVFLASLAVAGAIGIGNATEGWRTGVEGRLTVRIAALSDQPMEPRQALALRILEDTPEIEKVRALSRGEIADLLSPWLGKELLAGSTTTGKPAADEIAALDLPLPALIDVTLKSGVAIDRADLAAKLQAGVPGVELDDPTPWLGGLLGLARALQALAAIVALLTGLAMMAMVVAATRASLAAQAQTIEVLHVVGAQDGYIAHAFDWFVLRRAAAGAGLGMAAAALAMMALARIARPLSASIFPDFGLAFGDTIALLAVPVLALLLAVATAHGTVLGQLRRMT
jgi:cell division transport system permease protein